MRKRKQNIHFYQNLPDRLKPLGVVLGLSTFEEVQKTIKKHQGMVSYKDNDQSHPDIHYLFVSGLSGFFRLPACVTEVRFTFYIGKLFDMSVFFTFNDDLDFHRILRSLKTLYGYPKVDLRFAKWEYPTFWISLREEKDEELIILEYADREILNRVKTTIKKEA